MDDYHTECSASGTTNIDCQELKARFADWQKLNLTEMQAFAEQAMGFLGSSNGILAVINDTRTIAGAQGATLSIFGGQYHLGRILVNERYCSTFTDSDMQFIVAHECAHIRQNHLITSIAWALIEQWLKGERNENYSLVEGIKAAYAIFSQERLPPNALSLRDQEYEADEIAVRLTGDLNGAVECLRNLVGNNLDQLSHKWELFGNVVPAMTMRERIAHLQSRFPFGITMPSPFNIKS